MSNVSLPDPKAVLATAGLIYRVVRRSVHVEGDAAELTHHPAGPTLTLMLTSARNNLIASLVACMADVGACDGGARIRSIGWVFTVEVVRGEWAGWPTSRHGGVCAGVYAGGCTW